MASDYSSLVAVGFGWLLGQGAIVVRDIRTNVTLRRGLRAELEDIRDQLEYTLHVTRRHLQVYAHQGVDPLMPPEIPNLFFQQYFKDVFARMGRHRRRSYQNIHTTLTNLNRKMEELGRLLEAFYASQPSPNDDATRVFVAIWGERMVAIYKTARDIDWYVEHHLRQSAFRRFRPITPEQYREFEKSLQGEVESIVAGAKSFDRSKLEPS